MEAINVHDLIQKRALVTRQTAHLLEEAVEDQVAKGTREIYLDFLGVDAISPSFVDELFFVLANALADLDPHSIEVTFLHPPTAPTAAFNAIARAHKTGLEETPDRNWRISGILHEETV